MPMTERAPEVRRSLMTLRYDALEREMTDLAIVYGWASMRLGAEMLAAGDKFKDPPTPPHAFT